MKVVVEKKHRIIDLNRRVNVVVVNEGVPNVVVEVEVPRLAYLLAFDEMEVHTEVAVSHMHPRCCSSHIAAAVVDDCDDDDIVAAALHYYHEIEPRTLDYEDALNGV